MNKGFLTVYWRDMKRYIRFRTSLFSSLLMPAVWLAFFGFAMSANFDQIGMALPPVPGVRTVGYLTYMCAGVIAMTSLFTTLFGGFSLLFDKNWGLMREMFASPMPRSHIVTGISLSGVTKSWIQAIIIMVFGLLIGVEFFSGYSLFQAVGAFFGVLLFVAIFAVGFISLSATIALRTASPEGFQGITSLLTMPLFFVSSALYPIDSLPSVLQGLAVINPLTHLIGGIRYLAIGDNFVALGTQFAYSSLDIVISFLALALFAGVMFGIAWRTVNRAVVT
jgi:ABC-2 type transport system permease protein